MHLTKWTARRSGDSMVLRGMNEAGEEVKINRIWLIQPSTGCLVAEHLNGECHTLSTS